VFGVSVENWYRTSAVPYLLDTFSSDHSAEDALTFDPDGAPPYCQPGEAGVTETDLAVGEAESDTVDQVSSSIPSGVVAACGWFDSQQQAQDWFEANQDFREGVDTNGDGTACGGGDFGGATDCNGRAPELVLGRFCEQYSTN
jgi:hypothetical protein